MKEWLKWVLNYRSYPQIKLGIRFWDHFVNARAMKEAAITVYSLHGTMTQ